MKQVIDIVEDNTEDTGQIGFDIDKVVQKPVDPSLHGKTQNLEDIIVEPPEETIRRKKMGRPVTKESRLQYQKQQQQSSLPPSSINNVVPANVNNAVNNPPHGYKTLQDEKLEQKYAPNVNLLIQTIGQADYIFKNVEMELKKYYDNKAFGGKSRSLAMTNLLGAETGILNNKIAAIRELNSIRKSITDVLVKREQMYSKVKENEENSDKAIADAYNAMVNAVRYGLPAVNAPLAQSSINTGINLSGGVVSAGNLGGVVTSNSGPEPQGYNTSLSAFVDDPTLSPNQKLMLMEHNKNYKIVVFYDQSTGMKRFEALNVNTGQLVQGVQLPPSFLLDEMRIDLPNAVAFHSGSNLSYPLVVTGNRAIDEI